MDPDETYYRRDLAEVHHLGFGFHADACAPGILALLEPVRQRNGLVVELGCGSGLLTRHLIDAGHRVIATDASPAFLAGWSRPSPDRYVHQMTTFRRNADGSWRRDDERHDNVLLDTSQVPALLAPSGVQARIAPSFGTEQLPEGLVALVGHRPT